MDNLVDQRNVLKGTQRRLLDAANTLGLSRDVIGWIERRRYGPHQLLLMWVTDVAAQHTRHVHISGRRSVHVHLFLFDLEVSRLVTYRYSLLSVCNAVVTSEQPDLLKTVEYFLLS